MFYYLFTVFYTQWLIISNLSDIHLCVIRFYINSCHAECIKPVLWAFHVSNCFIIYVPNCRCTIFAGYIIYSLSMMASSQHDT